MPLPGFPYATIVGFGVLVVAAGLYMLFANQQQVPICHSSSRRRRSSPPPLTGGSWGHTPAREPSRNRTQGTGRNRSSGTEQKQRTSHGGYTCIICLDCEDVCRFVKLYCGHHFHSDCLRKWFEASERGKVCPTCNAVATSR